MRDKYITAHWGEMTGEERQLYLRNRGEIALARWGFGGATIVLCALLATMAHCDAEHEKTERAMNEHRAKMTPVKACVATCNNYRYGTECLAECAKIKCEAK